MKTDLYFIDGPWPGKLAIAPRPRGGDWLDDEVRAWKEEGIATVVSTLEPSEVVELELRAEPALCLASGIEFIGYPIADRGVPESSERTAELVRRLVKRLQEGRNVLVHCRQGIGRSSVLAACVLSHPDQDHATAFALIERARGRPVPDTPAQKDWVQRLVVKQVGSAVKN